MADDLQKGLDGFASLIGFRTGAGSVGLEGFLSGEMGGNGLPQFFVLLPGKIPEQLRAIDAGGAGVVKHRSLVVRPSVPDPEGDLICTRCGTAGGKLDVQLARLTGGSMMQ